MHVDPVATSLLPFKPRTGIVQSSMMQVIGASLSERVGGEKSIVTYVFNLALYSPARMIIAMLFYSCEHIITHINTSKYARQRDDQFASTESLDFRESVRICCKRLWLHAELLCMIAAQLSRE